MEGELRDVAAPRTGYAKHAFDVLVAATMSAGKSTVLNALLGRELLYSSNEPATMLHTRVRHASGAGGVVGAAYNGRGRLLRLGYVSRPDELLAWDATPDIQRLDLVGDFATLGGNKLPVALHDAPGANNSVERKSIALACIKAVPWSVLLYVLNVAHLGTTDDRHLLDHVRRAFEPQPEKQVVFLLNKVDLLDEERGESVAHVVKTVNDNLREHGFAESCVIPVMAEVALAARLVMSGRPTSRRQKAVLSQTIADLGHHKDGLVDAAIIPDHVRARLTDRCEALHAHLALAGDLHSGDWRAAALPHLPIASGLSTLEFLLEALIERACIA